MALDYTSDQISNYDLRPAAFPHSFNEVYMAQGKVTVDTSLADGHFVGLVKIPPNCVPVDICMYCDDIDAGSTLVYDVGVLDSAGTALVTGSKLVSAGTVGQAAGVQRLNVHNGVFEPATWLAQTLSPAAGVAKTIALEVTTTANSAVAGDIYATVWYRAQRDGH